MHHTEKKMEERKTCITIALAREKENKQRKNPCMGLVKPSRLYYSGKKQGK